MANELEDLKAAVAAIAGAVNAAVTEIHELAKGLTASVVAAGVDPAAVEAQAQALSGLATTLQEAVNTAAAAAAPPAAPSVAAPAAEPAAAPATETSAAPAS